MALPIFLRPLLLISHYYRVLTQTFTGWLAQSSDQLFGPLEQMIVAVVITGLAMNPGLLPQFHPQVPMAIPVHHIPVLHQAPPVQTTPPRLEQNITAPANNETSVQSASADSNLALLGSWRPDPIILSLVILLISVLIHIIPSHLFRRVKQSWDIFWPPWQDRSTPPRSSQSGDTGSTSARSTAPASTSKEASASARSADGSKAEARSGNPKSSTMTDEEKAKRKALMAHEAKKAAAKKVSDPASSSKEATASARSADDRKAQATNGDQSSNMTDEEKAKRKALLAYEAKKAAAKKPAEGGDSAKGNDDTKSSTPDPSRSSGSARSVEPVIIAKEPAGTEPKTQSDKAREAKDPLATPAGDGDDKKGSSNVADDPLMAGDYRSLKSTLKKSTKKPRQTKNIHHNHFMTMRGNRAHLVPFPHGLHPPPDQPRHSLWWKNIPRNADHMIAPPPVPKEVKDVLAGEDIEDIEAKPKVEPSKEGDKEKEKLKEREKEKEKAKMKAELEAREKAKAQQAKERAGTATASVSIEPPSQPEVPVDPQVQKAIWASQAMLCLLLFYIQQQLGLVLLAFFVWQQMNVTAARQSGETAKSRQPVATAIANAVAPPPSSRETTIKVPKEQDIPPEMKEKLARAKAEKEAKAKSESRTGQADEAVVVSRPDKGKGKEVVPESVPSSSKSTSKTKDKGDNPTPRALTSEERAAYRARAAKSSSSADKASTRSARVDEPMTKEKWAKMSDEDKKRYLSEREKRKQAQTAKDDTKLQSGQNSDKGKEASQREKWEKMSDEDKKKYLAEKEKRRAIEKSKPKTREQEAAAKAEKWDKLTDEEKQRYLHERQKREQARRAQLKAGESSGLSAEEKEKL